MSGFETMSLPVVAPAPGRIDKTPEGTEIIGMRLLATIENIKSPPASSASSANSSRLIGADYSCVSSSTQESTELHTSDGFTITEFPAASAGAIFLTAIKRGLLNGCESIEY
jgi:hypothetical protein